MDRSNQVILIGLDGLGLSTIGDMLDDGTLSTLRSIRERGTAMDVESTVPPWTPCAWPSLLSGRDPGEHGVFDFFTRDGYEKTLVDRRDVRAPYLWEIADEYDRTTLSINFPVTHPVPALEHGVVVPGYLAPEDATFSPPGLRESFEAQYGDYHIYPEYGAGSDAVEEYGRVARSRRDMARFLDERYDWDLLAVEFQVTDSVFHDLDDREDIRRVLRMVDEYVGDVVALADGEPTVFVVSDHGMGEYDWTFYVNTWLSDRGYCETTTGDPTYFRAKVAELRGDTDPAAPGLLGRIVEGAMTALSAAGVTPREIHRALDAVGLADFVERIVPQAQLADVQNRTVAWDSSDAFQLLFNSLGVHVNVEGTEPAGRVPAERYEAFREELMAELRTATDPDGELVFDSVEPREAVYRGANVALAPDVVLVPRDYRYDVSGSIVDTFRRNEHMNHKPLGMLLIDRPAADDAGPRVASIYDVAPTIAAGLGIPPDTEADGDVLAPFEATDEPASWGSIAGPYDPAPMIRTDDGSDGDVEQRLEDLGYLS